MLLAVDTSTQFMGLALYDGSQVLAETTWQTHSHHTVELAPAVEELFSRCNVHPSDLTVLAVALGPGSFTSLRIGLAVIKGLALAQHLPVIGIPTLDILAYAQPVQAIPLAAVLQAGRTRLAVGYYEAMEGSWRSMGEAQGMLIDELSRSIHHPTLVCGELTAEHRQALARKRKNVILTTPAQSLRRASFLAELAWERWQKHQVDDVITLAPIYLHLVEEIPG